MKQRWRSVRFSFIKLYLYNLFLTACILLAIILSLFVIWEPEWLTAQSIFLFIGLYMIIGFILSLQAGFTQIGNFLKVRLDAISIQIKQYANGNYTAKISKVHEEIDETDRIIDELNDLGDKLQRQVQSLQRMADEKADYAKSAHKAAVIEERQRIARDLHDAVSQELFGLAMLSETALKLFDKSPSTAKEQMQEVVHSAHQAQAEMRALLLHLRPVYLTSGETLEEGVQKLIDALEQKSNLTFQVDIDEMPDLKEVVEEHLFRIIQESLSNILRHANANTVKVEIKRKQEELYVRIEDDGVGFESENQQDNKASYGLKTMKERSEELGGTFAIRSKQGQGTYIHIRIPNQGS
ncbi:sensor histidine kinase [Oceanobacillus sp. FSL W8-0428]|uniref:Sensor histidine kinase n=1 Tax=Oceanobacillus sojae TaxID=582851 RepID=A0A511ZDZ3_9BACI|nr:sensor histidine kinase [Oceanobacillus sojae]GEN85663.1 sensor histidine kinase LiaS [Oceanobacillus sojae]